MTTNFPPKYLPRVEGENRPYIITTQVRSGDKPLWFAEVVVDGGETAFGEPCQNKLHGQAGKTEQEALSRLHSALFWFYGTPYVHPQPLWSSGD